MGFFSWLTQSVRAAVLRGFEQAAEDLELTADDGKSPLEAIKERMKPPAALTHEKPRKASKD